MKLFSLLIVVIAIVASSLALTDEQKEAAKKLATECLEQEKATEEDLEKLKSGDFSDPGDHVKCFTNCFLEKAGIVVDGVFQEAPILAFSEEHGQEIVDTCKDVTGDDKCDTSFKISECMAKFHGFD